MFSHADFRFSSCAWSNCVIQVYARHTKSRVTSQVNSDVTPIGGNGIISFRVLCF